MDPALWTCLMRRLLFDERCELACISGRPSQVDASAARGPLRPAMAHFAHLGENFVNMSSLMCCSSAADRGIAHMRYGDLCHSTHQPSLGSGAPLEGLGSNPVVEDLLLGHLGWSSRQERHHRRHHRREPLPPVGPGRAHFCVCFERRLRGVARDLAGLCVSIAYRLDRQSCGCRAVCVGSRG